MSMENIVVKLFAGRVSDEKTSSGGRLRGVSGRNGQVVSPFGASLQHTFRTVQKPIDSQNRH